MNTREILNEYLYPQTIDNVRRKSFPYFDTQTITAGTTQYYYFVTALGNRFLRNKRLPLAGSEVFFIEGISAYLPISLSTAALVNSFNEFMQQSYLEISVDNRVQCKLPGLDILNYMLPVEDTAPQNMWADWYGNGRLQLRNLPLPIILNSTSSFQFRFVTTAAAATAFTTVPMKLVLHGIQLDKLKSEYWDNLKNNKFQQVPVTYYDTVVIPNGNEQTFQLFANPAKAENLFSQTFPLSDIQTFACQNIEVFVNQPDTPIQPDTIFFSRLTNNLLIDIDDVQWYNSNLMNMLSMLAGLQVTENIAGAVYYKAQNIRQSKTFKVPIQFPANSKVNMSLTQPAGSLGITGEITVALRGVETRRVA